MSVATARIFVLRVVMATVLVVAGAFASADRAMAQGVTTGAARGRILDRNGEPVIGASVQLVSQETGMRFSATTSGGGAFYLANVVLGTYAIEARAIGYRPERRTNVHVSLGQVADIELRLEAAAVELAPIAVRGEAENALLSRGRTGMTSTVSEELIRNLPTLQRSFFDLTHVSPLVNGNSFAGQADRFNAIQVDGGSNGDLFGLNASNGMPGGRNTSRPISIEAVREFQVLIAPFDVRQGGFIGGMVNAVTRSGTNELHGSVFGFMQNDGLQGKDSTGIAAPPFKRSFYGFSLGGPIVRDRLHFFIATEWRQEDTPMNQVVSGIVRNLTDADTLPWSHTVGLSAKTAERIRQFSITSLGFDPGDWRQPQIPNPDRDLFFKLSGQMGQHQFELSYNNATSNLLVLTHDPFGANPTRLREGYQFAGAGYDNSSKNHSFRGRLNSQLSGRLTNEVIGSFYKIDDVRQMPHQVSLMIVGADSAAAHFALGGERFSQLNTLAQDVKEIQDNLTLATGNHVATVGFRYESFKFVNAFFPASLGAWYFPDTTSFFNRAPTRYERALTGYYGDSVLGRRDGPIADFNFSQFGLYAQEQWRGVRGLSLTLGLRADWTGLPQPAYNPLVDTSTVTVGPSAGARFGVLTSSRPTNALLLSPRLGFNYDVHGDQSFLVRGGAGIFTGRTPYVWASNAYTNTGLEQVQLACTGAGAVPVFQISPDSQYTACPGAGALALPKPSVVYFDQNFKLPQNLRLALGVDRKLPWNMVGSVDLLYTRAINQFLLEDVNLVQGGFAIGEGNRPLYGSLSATSSSSTPRRATSKANDVLRQFNSNQDYAYQASLNLTKRFSNGLEFSGGYTYSRSYDLMSPGSDISNSLLNFATLDGPFANRNLTPSFYDTPHSVRFSATTTLPYGVRFSLFYTGSSGRPYAYRYNNDVNGDNFSGNDLFYVPLNAQDINLSNAADYAKLDAFIQSEPCLRNQRGQIMQRNSCRNPWVSFVDARFGKTFQTVRGQSIEFTANLFNVLSFLGVGGTLHSTSGNENIAILGRTGYNAAAGRGIYSLLLPTLNAVQVQASRWKLELGGRYNF